MIEILLLVIDWKIFLLGGYENAIHLNDILCSHHIDLINTYDLDSETFNKGFSVNIILEINNIYGKIYRATRSVK